MKISADGKIEHCVRLDEATLEVHSVKNLFRKLHREFFRGRVSFELDRKAAIVTAAESCPQLAGKLVIHHLEDERIALVFFDIDSRTAWPHADVNRFTQK